jgi:hypothetical protein
MKSCLHLALILTDSRKRELPLVKACDPSATEGVEMVRIASQKHILYYKSLSSLHFFSYAGKSFYSAFASSYFAGFNCVQKTRLVISRAPHFVRLPISMHVCRVPQSQPCPALQHQTSSRQHSLQTTTIWQTVSPPPIRYPSIATPSVFALSGH